MHKDDLRFEFREFLMVPMIKVIARSTGVRRLFTDFGSLVNYINWAESKFTSHKFFGTRKNLLRQISKTFGSEICQVIELGVARGALTKWGLKNFPNPKLTWVGFDTFTGLPNDWTRNGNVYLAQGSFSTQGVVPRISDSRLSFVIGDVTTTCRKIPELLRNRTDGKVLFIFDLDLFAPSYAAWKEISPYLRTGDLFYFDQAFDLEGERLIIEEYLMKEKIVEFVGRSVIGCVFEIK
jgi:hypothetical protein